MEDFKTIDEARRVLGLPEEASLLEIKDSYRKLSLKYHPDRCKDEEKRHCEEMFKKINRAYDLIMGYCAGYKYSFRKEDISESTVDQASYKDIKRFYDGWLGDLDL